MVHMDSIRWVSDSSSIWDCLPRREDEERISQRLQSSKEGGRIIQRFQLDLGSFVKERRITEMNGRSDRDSSLIWDCLRRRQDWQK